MGKTLLTVRPPDDLLPVQPITGNAWPLGSEANALHRAGPAKALSAEVVGQRPVFFENREVATPSELDCVLIGSVG